MRLTCNSVGMSFNGPNGETIVALRDIDIGIASGEFVCLLGPSGCGKSTLLRLFAGLERPTSGLVQEASDDAVDGIPIAGPNPRRGMVFQELNLFPWRTARGNVEFSLECSGMPRRERHRRSLELLEMVGLEKWQNAYPSQMSGGMKQRVGIARALAPAPAVLLMDEPFAALDEPTREEMQEETLRIRKNSLATVVFVTHSIEEAIFLGERVVVMSPHPGRIERVFENPLPYPRDRVSADFVEYRREISGLMDQLHVH